MLNGFAEKKENFFGYKKQNFSKSIDSHAKHDLRARKFLARLHSPYYAW